MLDINSNFFDSSNYTFRLGNLRNPFRRITTGPLAPESEYSVVTPFTVMVFFLGSTVRIP